MYLCERKHNKLKLVVKEISTSLSGEQLKAAKNEVAILKSLDHPNIIRYYDKLMRNNVFYIVMEYATHGCLHDLISKKRPNFFEPQVCISFINLQHLLETILVCYEFVCPNSEWIGPYTWKENNTS